MSEDDRPESPGHLEGVIGIQRRGESLLLVRNRRPFGGVPTSVWDLPGGRVEPGERLRDALVREWREEVGLEARIGPLRLVVDGVKRREAAGPALRTWRALFFDVTGEGDPVAGEGIEEVRWVALDEARDYLEAPYHAPFLAFLEGEEALHVEVDWIDPLPTMAEATPASAPARAPTLGPELAHLVRVAASAAAGALDGVARAVEAARADGVETSRVEEALLQVVPYAGFPRAITAFAAVRPLLGPFEPPAEASASCASGPETFARVYGSTADRVRRGLEALHPDLLAWTHAFAYGRVLARHRLTLLEREVLAVGILTAMGGLEDPLLGHMRAAARLGATPDQLAAVIDVVRPVARRGGANAAGELLRRV